MPPRAIRCRAVSTTPCTSKYFRWISGFRHAATWLAANAAVVAAAEANAIGRERSTASMVEGSEHVGHVREIRGRSRGRWPMLSPEA
eukprot:6362216-Prymnesium_polylepis.1